MHSKIITQRCLFSSSRRILNSKILQRSLVINCKQQLTIYLVKNEQVIKKHNRSFFNWFKSLKDRIDLIPYIRSLFNAEKKSSRSLIERFPRSIQPYLYSSSQLLPSCDLFSFL